VKILVVEDDKKLSAYVAKGLRQAGYTVDQAGDGKAGLELALSAGHDAAVVDVMLPGLDGLSLVSALRKADRKVPVLFLSAKRSLEDRVRGLQKGGDDYLTKPFAFAELNARLEALLRRSRGAPEPPGLKVGDLSLDLLKREAARAGRRIELKPREFSLLELLMRHAPQTVSKAMILERVWDYRFDPQTNVVDVLVCRLRAKLEQGSEAKVLCTLRGVGYALQKA
jgi:two-component system OmpR family response regulator